MTRSLVARLFVVVALVATQVAAAEPAGPESKRLVRAKDYVNDERWPQAVDELRAAMADPKETRKDEVLYWLAHSLNQLGDHASSVETISRLERDYPSSMWVKPAGALRIQIAVRLNRSDVLWYAAMPPPPPPPAAPKAAKGPAKVRPKPSEDPSTMLPPAKMPPPPLWYTDTYHFDADSQILALSALMKTDSDKAIPLLTNYAFESDQGLATRAVFVLAQSQLSKAHEVVIQVAKTGPEPVKVAAVKALGRLGGPTVSGDLLQVYDAAGEPVKFQIVRSLGERADKKALERIVQSEKDVRIRSFAIEGLGMAGAVDQLVIMYKTAPVPMRRAIVGGLFNARADAELIRICEVESNGGDPKILNEARERLRLLSTPKAKEYLQKVSEKR